jgi:hypothetical protein
VDGEDGIRASDAEREATVAALNTAAAEGRLSLEEFTERARRGYASRTREDLASLVRDLPAPSPFPAAAPPRPAGTTRCTCSP